MTERRYRRLVALAVVAGFGLRMAWVLWATREPQGLFLDPTRYLGYARQIAAGNGYTEALTGDPTAYYPPGYPLFLGALAWLSSPFTDSVWMVAGLVQVLLGTVSVALCAVIARRLAGPLAGVVAAVVYACYPNLVFHTGVLLGETLYNALFLGFLAVLLARPWTVELSRRRLLAAGVLLGLAILVRPISLAVVPVVFVCFLDARKHWGLALRATGAVLAGVVLCLVPWTVRNAVVMDAFVPMSTNTGDNLCIGHGEGATGAFQALEYCEVPYPFLDGRESELKGDKAKQELAIEAILRDPGREPHLLWKRTYFMWVRDGDHDALFAAQSYRLDRWMALETEARLIWVADRAYWLVVAAGVAGSVVLARRREPEGLLLVGATVITALVPLAFFGDARFKVPVMPLLIIAGACLLHRDGHHRWPEASEPEPERDLVGLDAEASPTGPA